MKARLLIFLLLPVLSLFVGCREGRRTAYSKNSVPNAKLPSPRQVEALSRILASASISPYELEKFINGRAEDETSFVDFKPLWDSLHLSRDQDGDFDGFDPTFTRWRAETIDVAQPQLKLNKTILKISAYGGAVRRYLAFDRGEASSGEGHWHFSGYIDITDNYEASEETTYHRVVSDAKHVWLVLRTFPRIGTGIWAKEEIWYTLDNESPREVLKYPIEGARVMGEISDLEYKASIGESGLIDGRLTQPVRYTVSFGPEYTPKFHWLFSKRAQVHFLWNEGAGRFAVDSSQSDLSEEELDTSFGSANAQRFITYNISQLVRLARRATTEQQKWFERVIAETPEGTQKTALLQALNR
jgi:hypothetical protein